ncbi:MAG: D-alanine aminotransferase [Verrucomicrobiae bacterium]|nr:D-alanine aminotransferase [Verrucomicrobiae bacterium]
MPSINYAYVNGKFLPEAEACVSIFDRGFLYGDGCFETLRLYGGRLFRPLDHFARLFAGLRLLEIESPFSPEELRAVCRALSRWNNVTDGVARIYRTRDSIVVTVQARQFAPRELRVIISNVTLPPFLSRHKTANRLAYLLAQREAESEGADDAILLNSHGSVVELTTSNLFVVKKGQLYTPPLADGPLPGITRAVVLGLARQAGLRVYELSFRPEFLTNAAEIFATNSLLEIAPVLSWGRPGSVTRRLQTAYRQLVREELGL